MRPCRGKNYLDLEYLNNWAQIIVFVFEFTELSNSEYHSCNLENLLIMFKPGGA